MVDLRVGKDAAKHVAREQAAGIRRDRAGSATGRLKPSERRRAYLAH